MHACHSHVAHRDRHSLHHGLPTPLGFVRRAASGPFVGSLAQGALSSMYRISLGARTAGDATQTPRAS